MDEAEKRGRRRRLRLMQDESTWLQKALFALRKIDDAREKQADAMGEESPGPLSLMVDGHPVNFDALEDAIEERAQTLLQTIRERRKLLR